MFDGDERWQALPVPDGDTYVWDSESTYVQRPPFFDNLGGAVGDADRHRRRARAGGARRLGHHRPHLTGRRHPARRPRPGVYLQEHGVHPKDFNSFGSRRGNHQVMMRGTFGNIRLRNALADGQEGNWTNYLPDDEIMSIFDASVKYQAADVPLIVLAGAEYGTGSSRDWAAKGTLLLGVKAVIAKSFERIHRGNLVGMGVLPLEFLPGQGIDEIGLTGREVFDIPGLETLAPRQELTVNWARQDGTTGAFQVRARIDGPTELTYLKNGGILPAVLRRLHQESLNA